jgi:hypothetical protein
VAGAQYAVVDPGGPTPPPGPPPIYLPLVARDARVRPVPAPNLMVRLAFDGLSRVERLRMSYDMVDYVNPNVSANRRYEAFDGNKGTFLITQWKYGPRQGQRDRFIRWGDQGFRQLQGRDWECWRIDEHMLLWSQMVERLRGEFPTDGWQFKDPPLAKYANREVWDLERRQGANVSYMKVDVDTGLPLFMSRIEGTDRHHVYIPADFNDPSITTGKPRWCP